MERDRIRARDAIVAPTHRATVVRPGRRLERCDTAATQSRAAGSGDGWHGGNTEREREQCGE